MNQERLLVDALRRRFRRASEMEGEVGVIGARGRLLMRIGDLQ